LKSSSLSSREFLIIALIITAINIFSMPAKEGAGDAALVRYETLTLINNGTIEIPPRIGGDGEKGQYFYYNEKSGK
jgi:hypothetical protein